LDLCREYEKLYRGEHDVASLFNQFLRFFVNDLYRALKKMNAVMPKKANDEDFTKLVGKVAEQAFEETGIGGGVPLSSLISDGNETNMMMIVNRIVNKDNRFGLVMKLESSEMLRAAQTYFTLVETLGRRKQVLPEVFKRVIHDVEKNMPGLVEETEEYTSISDALEIIGNWLERIAERDPKLFQKLIDRLRSKEILEMVDTKGVK
jgi:hypothetical protein